MTHARLDIRMSMRRFAPVFAAGAAVALACPGGARGQTGGDPSQTLRGPDVKDDHAPGTSGAFSPMMENAGDKRPDDTRVPHEVFLGAVKSLRGEGVAPDLRLTPAQVETLEIAEREFRAELQAFRREHGAEMRELREALGMDAAPTAREPAQRGADAPQKKQKQGAGATPPSGPVDRRQLARPEDRGARAPSDMTDAGDEPVDGAPGSDDPAQDRQRERWKALMQMRPTGDAQRSKVWATLSEAQRAHVQAEIDQWRAQWLEKRKIDAGKLPPGAAERESMGRDEFRRRMEEKINSLPAEQREAARKKLEESVKRGRPAGEEKPAPGMETVDVPGAGETGG